jgi:hypothetical protein
MNDRNICFGFEPQNIIKDRCKKCFRLHSVHETASSKPSLRSNSSNHVKNSGIKDTTAGVERQQQSRLIEIRKQRLASVSLRSSMGTRQNSGRTRRTPEKASAAKRRSSDGETSTRVSATKPETGVSAKKVSRKVDKTEPTRDNVTTPTPYLTVEVHPASNRSSPIHRITVDELLENGNNASSSSNQPPDEPFGTVKTQNTVKKSVQEVPPKLRPHSSQNPGSAGDNGTDFNKRPNSCSVLMLKQQSTISFTSSTTSPIQKTFPANDFESPPPNSSDLCLSDKSSKAERKRTIRSAERHPNEDPVDYEGSVAYSKIIIEGKNMKIFRFCVIGLLIQNCAVKNVWRDSGQQQWHGLC